jgi:hypothetical protein
MEIGWKLIKHQIAQAFKKISTSSAYFITLNEFESKKVVIIGARPAGLKLFLNRQKTIVMKLFSLKVLSNLILQFLEIQGITTNIICK